MLREHINAARTHEQPVCQPNGALFQPFGVLFGRKFGPQLWFPDNLLWGTTYQVDVSAAERLRDPKLANEAAIYQGSGMVLIPATPLLSPKELIGSRSSVNAQRRH